VRVLELTDDEILVEQPSAAGQVVPLRGGVELIGAMTVGQNRWMFHTRSLGSVQRPGVRGRPVPALRLVMPDHVERCARRAFYRISTAAVNLPDVTCWPVHDPSCLAPAEIANRTVIMDMMDAEISGRPVGEPADREMLAGVGPSFQANLLNISGGGVGLVVAREDMASLESSRSFWLRVDLRPQIPAPIGITTRLAHHRIDSSQNIYAGLAFDFDHNPPHRRFVVDQITRYVAALQQQQIDAARETS
jgi:c-di-GMP-binding flagellar brake protein YcgR